MAAKQRNGMIDLMRFILTLCVAVTHLVNAHLVPQLSVLRGGTMSVEFFFVLSGFMLAASASRADKTIPTWSSTWTMMKRKVASIYPAWILMMAVECFRRQDFAFRPLKFLEMIQESASSFLMATTLGLTDNISIPYSWYIPVMLLCTLMLWPILLKWGKTFAYTWAPIIALFGCAYMFHDFNKLWVRTDAWLGFTYPSVVRGLAEMSLGVAAYEISMKLKELFSGKLTKTGRWVFTVLEVAPILYALKFVTTRVPAQNMLMVLLCFAVFIAVSYAGLSYTGKVVKGPFWGWLGKVSLSVYLAQSIPMKIMDGLAGTMRIRWFILMYMALVLICGLALHFGSEGLVKAYRWGKVKIKALCVTEGNA